MAQIVIPLCCYVNYILSEICVITPAVEDLTSPPSSADVIMRHKYDYVLILTPFSLFVLMRALTGR